MFAWICQGTSCPYRHETAALGHEQMCPKWKLGQCLDATCTNRHMIIEKTRSKIQCYWESKPSGCCKPHCVFKHTKRQNDNNNVMTDASGTVSSSIEQAAANAIGTILEFSSPFHQISFSIYLFSV